MKFKQYFAKAAYVVVLAAVSSVAIADSLVDFFRSLNVDDARSVSRLLQQGIDPNSVDERGQSALFVALRAESAQSVAVLLAAPQLRVDAANALGETPLMMAALRGNVEVARQLLARGAAVNREGWTPLHYAASSSNTAMVGLLLDAGAAIDAPSPNRSTPLMLAARYGAESSVDLLLRRGANPKLRNDLDLDASDFARQGDRDALSRRLGQVVR
jgi:ankyrin repeat protein